MTRPAPAADPPVVLVEHNPAVGPYPVAQQRLSSIGRELKVIPIDVEQLVASPTDVLWLQAGPVLTGQLLDRLPELRLVVKWGVGVDGIDLSAARERGIAVANAPHYCTIDVAEHALALMFSAARHLIGFSRMNSLLMPLENWPMPMRLAGRTVGVLGLGRIGARFAAMCAALGMRVLGFDVAQLTPPAGVQQVPLAQLLAEADVISVHLPGADSTRHLLDGAAFAAAKPGVLVINTGRGTVIDTVALLEALDRGQVGYAALDVVDPEPLPVEHPLRQHPRVQLTPHIGASSAQSKSDLLESVCETTEQFLATGTAPTLLIPGRKGAHA